MDLGTAKAINKLRLTMAADVEFTLGMFYNFTLQGSNDNVTFAIVKPYSIFISPQSVGLHSVEVSFPTTTLRFWKHTLAGITNPNDGIFVPGSNVSHHIVELELIQRVLNTDL